MTAPVASFTARTTSGDNRKGCVAGRAVVCQRPATAEVIAVCVHEHIRAGWVCERHLSRLGARGLICRECDEHPTASHECYLRGAS